MQILRYALVLVFGYALDMGGFILLFMVSGLDPILANLISKVSAAVFAFVAHRHFTFGKAALGGTLQQATRYFALVALNMPVAAILLAGLLRVVPIVVVAKFAVDVICALLNFWLTKHFVFLAATPKQNALINRKSSSNN